MGVAAGVGVTELASHESRCGHGGPNNVGNGLALALIVEEVEEIVLLDAAAGATAEGVQDVLLRDVRFTLRQLVVFVEERVGDGVGRAVVLDVYKRQLLNIACVALSPG